MSGAFPSSHWLFVFFWGGGGCQKFYVDPAGPRVYELAAVSVHLGVMGGGHYVAYARNPTGQWYYYNDSAVKAVSEDRVARENGYMLVYTAAGLGKRVLSSPTTLAQLGFFPHVRQI